MFNKRSKNNMKRSLSLEQKMAAYVLNQDPKYGLCSQKQIASLWNVSPSTISNAIKDIKNELRVRNLESELEKVRNELREEMNQRLLAENGIKVSQNTLLLPPSN